jgi:hypothetical protein
MPTYGLRLRTYSRSLGSTFDWFVPDNDMPDAPNARGYEVFRDIHTTPSGNTYLYDKGKIKKWELQFSDISTISKDRLEHIAYGWMDSQQVTMVYFGTSVIGTTETVGSMETAGQLWGTGWCEIDNIPQETAMDLWNMKLTIHQFGSDQVFTV